MEPSGIENSTLIPKVNISFSTNINENGSSESSPAKNPRKRQKSKSKPTYSHDLSTSPKRNKNRTLSNDIELKILNPTDKKSTLTRESNRKSQAGRRAQKSNEFSRPSSRNEFPRPPSKSNEFERPKRIESENLMNNDKIQKEYFNNAKRNSTAASVTIAMTPKELRRSRLKRGGDLSRTDFDDYFHDDSNPLMPKDCASPSNSLKSAGSIELRCTMRSIKSIPNLDDVSMTVVWYSTFLNDSSDDDNDDYEDGVETNLAPDLVWYEYKKSERLSVVSERKSTFRKTAKIPWKINSDKRRYLIRVWYSHAADDYETLLGECVFYLDDLSFNEKTEFLLSNEDSEIKEYLVLQMRELFIKTVGERLMEKRSNYKILKGDGDEIETKSYGSFYVEQTAKVRKKLIANQKSFHIKKKRKKKSLLKKIMKSPFITGISLIQIGIFIYSVILNKGFEPFVYNPLIGPSTETLIQLGAKDINRIVNGEIYRLITPMFLHVGLIHLTLNLYIQLKLGTKMENFFGTINIFLVYISSAIGGNIASCLFLPNTVQVGASGAIYGLLSLLASDLIVNWTKISKPMKKLFDLSIDVSVNLVIGLLPMIDNFAHIGGFVTGYFVGIIVIPDSKGGTGELYYKRRMRLIIISFIFLASYTIIAILFIPTILDRELCNFCTYFSCIPSLFNC